jgi:putative endonuclease
VTNDLERWASDHSLGRGSAFAKQYNANKLVYFEAFPDPQSAIGREKQFEIWSRAKKDALIAKGNREWRDLFEDMYSLKGK